MMRLRYSARSPFVRKVLVAAMELDLDEEIERVAADVWSEDSDIDLDNPLKRVPALTTEADGTFVDSTLICRYLDSRAGGNLFPRHGEGWGMLQLYQFADGVMESAVGWTVETTRRAPGRMDEWFVARHEKRILQTLDAIERDWAFDSQRVDIATITLACALGYLDFRMDKLGWRDDRPRLSRFYEGFADRPSMKATAPPA